MSLYQQYMDDSVLTASPMELVRTLYRFVIDNARDASRYTLTGDIEARGRAVNRATGGLVELMTSLNHQQGGELSARLADLYGYMASRLLQGHLEQVSGPFQEVEGLMTTLLGAWENVDAQDDTHAFAGAAYAPINASF